MSDGRRMTSRRTLLGGAVAGAAVVAAEAVHAAPARAADGDAVILGQTNEALNTTVINAKEAALWGRANTDDGALIGENQAQDGYGVRGTSPYIGLNAIGGKYGVYAVSDHGLGVYGQTYDGVAVAARTAVPQGTALEVEGTARFSRSGVAVVPGGRKEVRVTGVLLTAESVVMATMQQYRAGSGVSLQAAIPEPAANAFRLRLTAAAPDDTRVGWFIVN